MVLLVSRRLEPVFTEALSQAGRPASDRLRIRAYPAGTAPPKSAAILDLPYTRLAVYLGS